MHTVMVIFGTRPEAIKVAPLIQRLAGDPRVRCLPVSTAQHRFMLDQVLDHFDINPVADLGVMRHGANLTEITVLALAGLESILDVRQPDAVLVQGGATSALAGALAAFYHRTPVVHLEAGLRTTTIDSPYPEEGNRRVIGQLAALHLAPTPLAARNLLGEGARGESVVVTGNTVIDALQWTVRHATRYQDPRLAMLDHDPRRVVLVTAHRRESWGAPMREVAAALAEVAAAEPDVLLVLPAHCNPVVRAALLPALDGLPNVHLTEPLGYADFCRLMNRSHLVLTDSGGIQDEAPSLGKPVLVLRDTTERPEGVAAGTARLVGTDRVRIVTETRRLLHDDGEYARMARAVSPYGDGRAAERVVAALLHLFGEGPPVGSFPGSPRFPGYPSPPLPRTRPRRRVRAWQGRELRRRRS
jgi:UDP-N-acetylglucosamine 2-epimerase (non-hydrolysing)